METSFAADERRSSRLRVDHVLHGTIEGTLSLEVSASDVFVTSSRVCLRRAAEIPKELLLHLLEDPISV